MKVICVVQARLGSSRFPGKVLSELRPGLKVIDSIFLRLKKSNSLDEVVFAIPDGSEDDRLATHLESLGAPVIRGNLFDVQSRYINAGEQYEADFLVRITGDCPLVDWEMVDTLVQRATSENLDYCSNVNPPTFPDGLDVEVINFQKLLASRNRDSSMNSLEHVTVELRTNKNTIQANIANEIDLSSLRWTVDFPEDLEFLQEFLPENFLELNWTELAKEDSGRSLSTSFERNAGMSSSSGAKVWDRAKKVIPGGSMLLSKRPELFLPEHWPSYYSKAQGITVTDLDQRQFLDFATMSVGACSLGYGNQQVDAAVINAVKNGVMSTLNSYGEVNLAERLVSLHPWSQMVRLARSGGEANAIAVRISRAFTGKSKIAICGYHGWHDWYLSANLDQNSHLDGHLLPGLEPAGVPRELVGTTVPFNYNDIDSLANLLKTGEFAAVQMEVSRNFGPSPGFLESVRNLCDEHNVVLIFDECTSGFRETFGGLHLKFGVYPDMAMFGKALGNGYAITAVIGREDVMQSAQKTFISSTFWTERLGPEAALATLDEMEKSRSWEILPERGRAVKTIWSEVLQQLEFDFKISGLDALPSFSLSVPHWPILKTLFTQEMLERGFLATGAFYASTQHDLGSIDLYRTAFEESMALVSEHRDEEAAMDKLKGPVAHSGFARLN